MIEMSFEIVKAMMRERDRLYRLKRHYELLLGDIEKRIRKTPNDSDTWTRFYRTIQVLHSFQVALDALDTVCLDVKELRMEGDDEGDDQT